MSYILEVQSDEWAGTLRDGWRPALDGTLNSTSSTAECASRFRSYGAALEFVPVVADEHPAAIRIRNCRDGSVPYLEMCND